MSEIDLLSLFSSVTATLQENQASLNKADSHNGDHGDNMVDIFSTISSAIQEKDGAAQQLAHASKILSQKQSGSAQLYASGLAQAAEQFKGGSITQEKAVQLIQTMMGGGAQAAGPIEGLLGGLLGGGKKGAGDAALDVGDLLNAGLTFFSSKQQGDSNIEALMDAIMAASPMSQTPHRQQSSQLVINSMLQMLTQKS